MRGYSAVQRNKSLGSEFVKDALTELGDMTAAAREEELTPCISTL